MVKSKVKDFLSEFQTYLKNIIPDIILNILKNTGYDTPIAIESIDDNVIQLVEEYIEQQRNKNTAIAKLLKNSIYSEIEPFAFLLGHKALLVGLKNKLAGFEEQQSLKKVTVSSSASDNFARNFELDFDSAKENLEENVASIAAQSSAQLKGTQELDQELLTRLKSELTKKVNNFASKKKIRSSFARDSIVLDIGDIEKTKNTLGKTIYKCYLKCFVCAIRKPCTYTLHWQISNYECHLTKTHLPTEIVNNQNFDQNPDQNNQANNSTNLQKSPQNARRSIQMNSDQTKAVEKLLQIKN